MKTISQTCSPLKSISTFSELDSYEILLFLIGLHHGIAGGAVVVIIRDVAPVVGGRVWAVRGVLGGGRRVVGVIAERVERVADTFAVWAVQDRLQPVDLEQVAWRLT